MTQTSPSALATSDFEFICALVRERSAIVLEPGKEYLVSARLHPVVQQHGLPDIRALVEQLRRGAPALATHVVEAMTTNETSFFRDLHPFEVLRTTVVPDVMSRRASTRALRIWSAAASTGQEAYSIVMALREGVPQLAGWNVSVLGTDLSSEVIEKATHGRYSQIEVNRGLPAPLLLKYFERAGTGWQVKPDVRAAVQFRTMNLVAPWPALPAMDIVFLRNVLIYFDTETKRDILAKVRRALAPDGYLFLGGAESTLPGETAFTRVPAVRANCYRIAAP